MKNSKSNKRKMAVAVLAGLALTGMVGASAASLNGINGASLGADADEVISCDDDGVDVSYATTFVPDSDLTIDDQGYFDVDTVVVGAVSIQCDGLDYEVVLLDDNNDSLGSAAGIVDLASTTDGTTLANDFGAAMSALVDAELVTGIAITISG